MTLKEKIKEISLKNKAVIHCETEDEANELLNIANELGLTWSNGDGYSVFGYYQFEEFKNHTCFNLYTGNYGGLNYYLMRDYQIYNFNELKKQHKSEFKQENIKSGMLVEFRSGFIGMIENDETYGLFVRTYVGCIHFKTYMKMKHPRFEEWDIIKIGTTKNRRTFDTILWNEKNGGVGNTFDTNQSDYFDANQYALDNLLKRHSLLYGGQENAFTISTTKAIRNSFYEFNPIPKKIVYNAKLGRTTLIYNNNHVIRSEATKGDLKNSTLELGVYIALLKKLELDRLDHVINYTWTNFKTSKQKEIYLSGILHTELQGYGVSRNQLDKIIKSLKDNKDKVIINVDNEDYHIELEYKGE